MLEVKSVVDLVLVAQLRVLVRNEIEVALVQLEVFALLLSDLLDAEELLLEPSLCHVVGLVVLFFASFLGRVLVELERAMALEEAWESFVVVGFRDGMPV